MAKCHLQIRHKSPGHRYRPGDEIRGTLIVEAHEPCHCEWARVLLTWRAEGDHDTDTGVAAHEQFSVGTLEFDSQREFPFQFTLPSHPPPYAGQTLQIQ